MRRIRSSFASKLFALATAATMLLGATAQASTQIAMALEVARGDVVELCTATGFVRINLRTGERLPGGPSKHHVHCECCVAHGANAAAIPPSCTTIAPAAVAIAAPLPDRDYLPPIVFSPAPANPRAPPQHS